MAKEDIEKRYGALARDSAQAACYDGIYGAGELAEVPVEAAELSLGCGNPVAMASLRPGEVVLDIGSGSGIDAFLAAAKVGPTGRVIGLDMTEAMTQRAQRAAETAGIENVEFRLGEAENMPLADASVDVVISNCVINLSQDKGRVFVEAFRVLRPGGRLMISDIVSDRPLPAGVRDDPEAWCACVGGAIPEDEYTDLMREAGFGNVLSLHSLDYQQAGDARVFSASIHARKP